MIPYMNKQIDLLTELINLVNKLNYIIVIT